MPSCRLELQEVQRLHPPKVELGVDSWDGKDSNSIANTALKWSTGCFVSQCDRLIYEQYLGTGLLDALASLFPTRGLQRNM